MWGMFVDREHGRASEQQPCTPVPSARRWALILGVALPNPSPGGL